MSVVLSLQHFAVVLGSGARERSLGDETFDTGLGTRLRFKRFHIASQ